MQGINMRFSVMTQSNAFGIGKGLALNSYLKDCNFFRFFKDKN